MPFSRQATRGIGRSAKPPRALPNSERMEVGARFACLRFCPQRFPESAFSPVAGVYPPPRSSGMSRLRGKSRKIFDVKELIVKIFRTKHLASAVTVLWGHARRIRFAH